LVTLLTLLLGPLGLVTAPGASAATPGLANEFLSSLPAAAGGGTCTPSGTSLITFSVSGVASGPYPGTFTETGTVQIGPQTEEFVPGQFRGDITAFHSDFTITSPLGTVTGSTELVPNTTANKAVCGSFGGQIIASALTYTATIISPEGTFTDSGRTFDNFNYCVNAGNCGTSSSNQFRHGFPSSNGVVPVQLNPQCSNGTDDDADGLSDFPADPGCESTTDDTESPNPVVPLDVPTSAAQCKNGGYRSFPAPGFKNQGDCVSFVATHGKNLPSGP